MTSSTHTRFSGAALALGTTLALFGSLGLPAHAAGTSLPAVARATVLRQGDVVTGALSGLQPMHVAIALKLRNQDQLDSLIAAHRTLTSAEFATRHAPTYEQARTVANYLTIMGYHNVVIAPNRLLVTADGTSANAQTAFQTSFARVQTKEGRIAFANRSDAHIPALLQDSVLSVMGLQSVHRLHTFAKVLPAGVSTNAITAHHPTEFSSIYGGSGVLTAAGVTVGIVTIGNMNPTIVDLNTFTDANQLARVTTQTVATGGTSSDTSGVIEWNLDSQSIVGMGGGRVGKIIFYAGPTYENSTVVASFNTAVAANVAKVIDVSLGECEVGAQGDGSAVAADQIFKAGVAQGQTFSISTGDFGADECQDGGVLEASWPANSPYVVAAAGTTLNASSTTWAGETVWAGSGGSPSTYEPKPSFQNALVPGTKRGVADIAFDADPYSGELVTYYGGFAQVGGTSLAAPLFAGMWARVIAVKGTTIGFAAPWLYQLPTGVFHDVTVGNNGGEAAKVGYDFATGRGSLILNQAIPLIGSNAPPPLVVNFSLSSNGLLVKFIDTSTDSGGTILSHKWNFGDGGTSTATNPTHLYPRKGTYTVTETVTDSAGYALQRSKPVNVGAMQ